MLATICSREAFMLSNTEGSVLPLVLLFVAGVDSGLGVAKISCMTLHFCLIVSETDGVVGTVWILLWWADQRNGRRIFRVAEEAGMRGALSLSKIFAASCVST